MIKRVLLLSAAGALFASHAYAASCDGELSTSLRECERIVGSLRPDKAGQMRVYASDGSEFTAGQAMWMKGQLRDIEKDCTVGNLTDAQQRLADVQELINKHHRAS